MESENLGEEDRVFGTITAETLRPDFEAARRVAGLEDVWFHDLKHTYAVHCAKAGMPLGELQQRLGHASITMTMRYACSSESSMARTWVKCIPATGK